MLIQKVQLLSTVDQTPTLFIIHDISHHIFRSFIHKLKVKILKIWFRQIASLDDFDNQSMSDARFYSQQQRAYPTTTYFQGNG